jgi:CheY-like chemotaxis protein
LVHPQPSVGSILVVEDTRSLRDILAAVLTQVGYRVISVANGTEALSCLKSGAPIGLILLDLVMPMMDGWQFRAEQQRDPRLRNIPVIIVSGEPNLAYQAAALGVEAYLAKPTPISLLLSTVRMWLPMETAAV